MNYNDYLAHHGILGQRWGKKNGPPYPLGSGDHSASERKAGWRASLSSKSNNKKTGGGSFHLTDKQKKALKIGAAVAATALLAYGGYRLAMSPYGRRVIGNMFAKNNPSVDSLIENGGPKIVKKDGGPVSWVFKSKGPTDVLGIQIEKCATTKEQDLKLINKGAMSLSENIKRAAETGGGVPLTQAEQMEFLKVAKQGNLNNCTFCTYSGILRRLGYDVKAGTTEFNMPSSNIFQYFKGANLESGFTNKSANTVDKANKMFRYIDSKLLGTRGAKIDIDKISSKISGHGDGTGGALYVSGKRNGITVSHCVEYFVEGGKVKVFDNQLGKSYNSLSDFFTKTQVYSPRSTYFARLDNCEPDLEEMLLQGVIRKFAP